MGLFFNKALSTEGNIFKTCTMTWLPLRKVILRGLWNAASALEGQAASKISKETITEVVEAVGAEEGMGVQVD